MTSQPVQGQSQETYYYALKRFQKFAEELQIPRGQALPTAPGEGMDTLLLKHFLVWAEDKYAPNTIQLTLSAISDWHRSKGLTLAIGDRIEVGALMKTLKVKLGLEGNAKQKMGISMELFKMLLNKIMQMKAADMLHKGLYLRDQAFLVLLYFGFLRRSETLALRLGDISVRRTPEGRLYLHLLIRKSKTDIYSEGVELCIAYSSQSGIAVFLLVQLYLDYLKLWSVSPQEALFQSFVDKSERPVTTSSLGKDALSARLRYYLKLVAQENPGLGLDVTTYASHSLRRGGVSAAWQCDVGRELLKGHGRWSSDAIDLYLHAGLDTKLTVTGRM
jgi:integrase